MLKLFEDVGCKDWLDVACALALGLVGAAAVYGCVLAFIVIGTACGSAR